MPLDSDKEMKTAVLDRCQTALHPCSTSRLSKSIEQGMVDPNRKVHEVENLQVVDASTNPSHLRLLPHPELRLI